MPTITTRSPNCESQIRAETNRPQEKLNGTSCSGSVNGVNSMCTMIGNNTLGFRLPGRLRVLVFGGADRQFIPQDFIDFEGVVNVAKSYIRRSDYS